MPLASSVLPLAIATQPIAPYISPRAAKPSRVTTSNAGMLPIPRVTPRQTARTRDRSRNLLPHLPCRSRGRKGRARDDPEERVLVVPTRKPVPLPIEVASQVGARRVLLGDGTQTLPVQFGQHAHRHGKDDKVR